ncbi:MAG: hypothetical protein Q7I99_07730 [Acholeplasmataceae bacterium]|nr:hypothetical protein [Acholeplasmataceae bacterium]
MFKKIYLIGLVLTLIMLAVRLIIIRDIMTSKLVMTEILLTLLVSHLVFALSIFIMRLVRFMYDKDMHGTVYSYVWIAVSLLTISGLVIYAGGIYNNEVNQFLYNGVWMISMGLWMENHLARMEELEEETKKYTTNDEIKDKL